MHEQRATLPRGAASVAAIASGLLLAMSVVVPRCGVLALGALAPLLVATHALSTRRAAANGMLSGFVAAFVGFSFLQGPIAREGGVHPLVAWGLVGLQAAWVAGPIAIATAVHAKVERRGRDGVLAFAACLALLERIWPMPIPFAWGLGLAHDEALVASSAVVGPVAPTLLAALTSGAAARAFAHARKHGLGGAIRAAIAPALVAVALVVSGLLHRARIDDVARGAPRLRVGLVQSGVEPRRSTSDAIAASNHLAREGADVVVWSESALSKTIAERHLDTTVPALFGSLEVPVVVGAIVELEGADHANSALSIERGLLLARHDKRRLLLFAEALPLSDSWPTLRAISPKTGRFRPGSARPALEVSGTAVVTSICFEDTHSASMRDLLGETRGQLVVNLTNDAWFSESHARETHLLAGKLRAIELGRAVVRATTNGATAAIDPSGRVVARLEHDGAGELLVDVPRLEVATPWARWGDAMTLLSIALVAGASLRRVHANG